MPDTTEAIASSRTVSSFVDPLSQAFASAVRQERDHGEQGVSAGDTDDDAAVLDVVDRRAPEGERHRPVGHRGHQIRTPWRRYVTGPGQRHASLGRGEPQAPERIDPGVGPGTDDAPLRRVGAAGALLLCGHLAAVRVVPLAQPARRRCEGGVHGGDQIVHVLEPDARDSPKRAAILVVWRATIGP